MYEAPWVPIAALQHYMYCPRQCALIHVEQQWMENRYTAEGRIQHERVDQRVSERRRGVHTATALALGHEELRVTGVADVVEFDRSGQRLRVTPIEHKRGRRRTDRADEVQLCAQALCLESMLGLTVEEGALFYGKTRRRCLVAFDTTLRDLTMEVIDSVRGLLVDSETPTAHYDSKLCDNCSLLEKCQPVVIGKRRSATAWLRRQLQE